MGCRVKANQHGRLALRVFWSGLSSWEGTPLRDTRENRERLQRLADLITAEMRAGLFDAARYLHYFPAGNRSAACRDVVAPSSDQPAPTSIAEYFATWMAEHEPPTIRQSLYRERQGVFRRYVLPRFGGLALDALTTQQLQTFRKALQDDKLKLKTIRNIIDGVFRALYRDARAAGLVADDPFAGLRWPRLPAVRPDPFDEDERDQLLGHFASDKVWEYPFLATLFLTGMRPSEAVALRWGDVDTRRRSIEIVRSRHLGQEAATKTAASTRTIRISGELTKILEASKPRRAEETAYVFTSRAGTPVDQSEWPKTHWYPTLKTLGIRPRKFYATRSTYISLALTYGANVKALGEHCGTSIAMIEKHYGKHLGRDDADPLTVAQRRIQPAKSETFVKPPRDAAPKPQAFPLVGQASPTGFEPVLPA